MRIGFVVPYFYPAWSYGGTPRSAFELACGLVERGHQVKVLTTDSVGRARLAGDGASPLRRSVEGIDVLYYRNLSNYLAFQQRLFWPLGFRSALPAELRGCDVIHVHEFRSVLTVSARSAAEELSLPYVLSPHGGLRRLGKAGMKRVFDWVWGRRILNSAAAVAALSPLEESEARGMGVPASKIRVIPNAVSERDYRSLPEDGIFRRRWDLEGKRIVLFLGRLHRIKGPDLLLRAFSSILSRASDAHLVLAGPDDGYGLQVRRLTEALGISARVTLTGFLEKDQKLEALVDASLTVIPSRSEMFPITALESLFAATPVLLSSACGLHPDPGTERGVLRFESENVDELATTLLRALTDPACVESAQKGREFARREFSVDAVARIAEQVYEHLVPTLASS